MNVLQRLLKQLTGFTTHSEAKANEATAQQEAQTRLTKIADEAKKPLTK